MEMTNEDKENEEGEKEEVNQIKKTKTIHNNTNKLNLEENPIEEEYIGDNNTNNDEDNTVEYKYQDIHNIILSQEYSDMYNKESHKEQLEELLSYNMPKRCKFTYEHFIKSRNKLPNFSYMNILYFAICNNGYIKLRTGKGNNYWLLQNENSHLTPDWKFHISVIHEHIPLAWNIVSNIFVHRKCWEGIKTMYLKENTKTKRGREITIYIFRYFNTYKNNSIDSTFSLLDERSEGFWYDLYEEIEKELEKNEIISNGVAKGDLILGKYVSFRNEAYVSNPNYSILDSTSGSEFIYPPDKQGWNAAEHKLPFSIRRFNNSSGNSNSLYSTIGNILNTDIIDLNNSIVKIFIIFLIWSFIVHKIVSIFYNN